MKKLIYIFLAAGLAATAGCQKDKYFLYNDTGRIQFGPDPSFQYRSGYELADTVKSFTFVYEDEAIHQDTVFFDIYTVGGTSKKDRQFKLAQVQVDGLMNAQPDKHYVGFDNPDAIRNFVIPADSVHKRVPIILLRDASLKDTSVVLKFEVVDGGDFAVGQQDNLWRQIGFTDRLSQPGRWDATFAKYYFGDYSVTKHKFMIDSTGKKWDDDFITEIYADYALLSYWKGVCKNALIKYNNIHKSDPLKDEYGQLVIFP
ncbi:protein of unknown function [Arachidicoccus rhizosphaerae]|uniref:DUF4843 domain-containing protein n=1 Tax=Arachidicoccus rhizosphaerae TaxID=551991 RepID=A0A1H3VT44_9BACT|nr:DUF4843 domain-containing protein [Arachidicoccus rhizosphaerae]SDZ77861.1 protein of unknown function [Arachidicoccus rhizosphaerae]